MKKAALKVVPGANGFIQTTLAPINQTNQTNLGWWDVIMFVCTVIGGLALARLLIAH